MARPSTLIYVPATAIADGEVGEWMPPPPGLPPLPHKGLMWHSDQTKFEARTSALRPGEHLYIVLFDGVRRDHPAQLAVHLPDLATYCRCLSACRRGFFWRYAFYVLVDRDHAAAVPLLADGDRRLVAITP